MSSSNFYQRLGVSPYASTEEIKVAFRKKAPSLHPDTAGPELAWAFRDLREAYETLVDLNRRGAYDLSIGFAIRRDPEGRPQHSTSSDSVSSLPPQSRRASRDVPSGRNGYSPADIILQNMKPNSRKGYWEQPLPQLLAGLVVGIFGGVLFPVPLIVIRFISVRMRIATKITSAFEVLGLILGTGLVATYPWIDFLSGPYGWFPQFPHRVL